MECTGIYVVILHHLFIIKIVTLFILHCKQLLRMVTTGIFLQLIETLYTVTVVILFQVVVNTITKRGEMCPLMYILI